MAGTDPRRDDTGGHQAPLRCARCGQGIEGGADASGMLLQCSSCGWWSPAPGSSLAPRLLLAVIAGPHPGVSREVSAGAVLGRGREATFQLADPDVSRRHARIVLEGGRLAVEDLGSRHGTFVAGARVDQRAVLEPGCELRLGPSTVLACRSPAGDDGGPAGPAAASRWDLGGEEIVRASCTPETAGLLSGAGATPDRLQRAHEKLKLVYSAVEALSTLLDSGQLVERLLELLFDVVPADRGAVLILDSGTASIQSRVVRSRAELPPGGLVVSSTIVGRVLNDRVGLLVEDTSRESGLGAGQSIVAQDIRSALCTPILYGEKLFGAIYLDAVGRTSAFDLEDLEATMALSRQAAIRLENAELVARIRDEAVARADLQRYLPGHLVGRVFRKEIELKPGGTRGEVTVLFTDLRDFTRHSSTMEPEQVIELLNAYFEEMVDTVFKYEGTLDKFIGDALMAVWGGPLPCEDGPMQAVRCALEMQARVHTFNQLHSGRGWPLLAMGVGINTGPALVGNLGASRRMEYTVLGHTVNLASRLESLNKELGTRILVSDEMWSKLDGRALGEERQVTVKGVAEPITVHSIEAIREDVRGPAQERRRAPRLQVASGSPAVLRLASRRLEGVVVSASRTGAGLLVACDEAGSLASGEAVELEVHPEGGGPVTRARGTIVRVSGPDGAAAPHYRVGIELVEEPPDPAPA